MKTITINNVEVEFQVIENEIFTSSLQIAKVFEKEHDEVVAEIDDMRCDFEIHDGTCHIDELYSKSVKWSTYIDENGQEQKMCLLSKDGFVFLFIRFDVTYAIEQEWGLRYIKAYNAAKDELIRTNAQKGKSMKQMNETQQKAFEIYLESATFESDYKPISEEQLASKLEALGLKGSSSSINRWKKDFNWTQALQNKVTLAMSEDKQTRNLLQRSSLQMVVKNTKVDIERNNVLLAASYEIMESEAKRIVAKQRETGTLSAEDFERAKFISTLSAGRSDKMLDRLAIMPPEAVSAEQILSRLNGIKVEFEDDVIDAEVQDEKASS